MKNVKKTCTVAWAMALFLAAALADRAPARAAGVSEASQACLDCHEYFSPDAVSPWREGAHAKTTIAEAMRKPEAERKVSATSIKGAPVDKVVGCAECHALRPEAHADTFDHNGRRVHVVVSPADCAVCHPVEKNQFDHNIMSRAHGNLTGNPVWRDLMVSINGIGSIEDGAIVIEPPGQAASEDSCLFCHGTKVKVLELVKRDTALGPMSFPRLDGWPNQGIGRVNTDGSLGACTGCHPRHRFSMAFARSPRACQKCHTGPDVPAYKVYSVSRHGNIFEAHRDQWNMEALPWVAGRDFTAPACAVCHIARVDNKNGERIAERTHRMNDRLPWRIFGLPYAHPHPIKPDTTIIRNKDGQPMPSDLAGGFASEFLISEGEREKRKAAMLKTCSACHARDWYEGHYRRFENTVRATNEMTRSATEILERGWSAAAANGPAQGDSIFNDYLEKLWVEQWLFYANSTRFASAMAGADYGVFANGRWHMQKNLAAMRQELMSVWRHRKAMRGIEDVTEPEK